MKSQWWLYRHFDGAPRLLYVGITGGPYQRNAQHRLYAFWWPELRSTTWEPFDTWEEARAAERRALATENPKYNIEGVNPPRTKRHLGTVSVDAPFKKRFD